MGAVIVIFRSAFKYLSGMDPGPNRSLRVGRIFSARKVVTVIRKSTS